MNTIKSEINRLTNLLPTIDPIKNVDIYATLLGNINSLSLLGEKLPKEDIVEIVNNTTVQAIAEAKPASTAPVKNEAITTESVRSMLVQARTRGVLIQPIISKYVPEGKKCAFTSIPASSYPDLIKDLEAANAE